MTTDTTASAGIRCDMNDAGRSCNRYYEKPNGCPVHAKSSLHRRHRIVVNGNSNRWCEDCSEWVDFDAYRSAEPETRA